ncbi:unnamed protein product [Dicrocoelium dendriticum]|nr:unnamed protein product [Dicrocoelium dendriticum]
MRSRGVTSAVARGADHVVPPAPVVVAVGRSRADGDRSCTLRPARLLVAPPRARGSPTPGPCQRRAVSSATWSLRGCRRRSRCVATEGRARTRLCPRAPRSARTPPAHGAGHRAGSAAGTVARSPRGFRRRPRVLAVAARPPRPPAPRGLSGAESGARGRGPRRAAHAHPERRAEPAATAARRFRDYARVRARRVAAARTPRGHRRGPRSSAGHRGTVRGAAAARTAPPRCARRSAAVRAPHGPVRRAVPRQRHAGRGPSHDAANASVTRHSARGVERPSGPDGIPCPSWRFPRQRVRRCAPRRYARFTHPRTRSTPGHGRRPRHRSVTHRGPPLAAHRGVVRPVPSGDHAARPSGARRVRLAVCRRAHAAPAATMAPPRAIGQRARSGQDDGRCARVAPARARGAAPCAR